MGYQLLLGVTLLYFLFFGSYAERISINAIENRDHLSWKRVTTVCMKKDLFITYRIVYNADRGCCPKLLMYNDQQYQKMLYMKALEIVGEGPAVHGGDVAKKLYAEGNDLMNQVESRLESSHPCVQVKSKQMQLLDPSQIVDLCPRAGIAITNQGKSYRSCIGGVKLSKQVSLPNLTIAQSWYGRNEYQTVDTNDQYWTENTWHFAITNCPSNGPLRISYNIIIDSVSNLGKAVTDKSYEDPMLQSRCSRIMLPYELLQYVPHGGAQRPMIHYFRTISVCVVIFCKFFLQ